MSDKKRIRFVKSDGVYQPGDVAGFDNHDVADAYVLRGSAVPAGKAPNSFTDAEDEALEPDDLKPSAQDKAEAKAKADEAEDEGLSVDLLNEAIDEYRADDSLEALKALGKEYEIPSYHVRGFDSLVELLTEFVPVEERDQVVV